MTNTVNPNNFNSTMDGYVRFAIDFTKQALAGRGYTQKQIEEITEVFLDGVHWAKDEMSMTAARNYKSRL